LEGTSGGDLDQPCTQNNSHMFGFQIRIKRKKSIFSLCCSHLD